MPICSYSFEEYVECVRSFHNYAAPGVVIGGFMVDLACRKLPTGVLTDALCETAKCLPDAIQILTPCTIGNGWLKVVNLGRFALTLYDKHTGEGVRVAVDPIALEGWPEIRDWFFKFKSKEEQDVQALMAQIEDAGASCCHARYVKVSHGVREKKHRAGFTVCARCGEAFPLDDGLLCLGCQGEPLWEASRGNVASTSPAVDGTDGPGGSRGISLPQRDVPCRAIRLVTSSS
jgi:formylmethanofuran dehydrogenase subunit E